MAQRLRLCVTDLKFGGSTSSTAKLPFLCPWACHLNPVCSRDAVPVLWPQLGYIKKTECICIALQQWTSLQSRFQGIKKFRNIKIYSSLDKNSPRQYGYILSDLKRAHPRLTDTKECDYTSSPLYCMVKCNFVTRSFWATSQSDHQHNFRIHYNINVNSFLLKCSVMLDDGAQKATLEKKDFTVL